MVCFESQPRELTGYKRRTDMWQDILGGIVGGAIVGAVVALLKSKLQEKEMMARKRMEVTEDFLDKFFSFRELMEFQKAEGGKIRIGSASILYELERVICTRIHAFSENKRIRRICEEVERLSESDIFRTECNQMAEGKPPGEKIKEFYDKSRELHKLLKRSPI